MKKRIPSLNLLWQLSLSCFILAGLTGFLYRLGLTGSDLWGLSLENIRHAHSHLMFFGWAVPLPMYFIIRKVSREINANGPNILMTRMAMASLFLGVASYPFFLIYGYHPVPVAGINLPFSVILSGLVMLCWYGFMAGYWRERKHVKTDLSIQFYDGALLMLLICSLGAWGVAVVQFSGIENPLSGKALTHFFLATFTEGWIVLTLLGLLYERMDIGMENPPVAPGLLVGLILFGAPLTFPYGISEGLMTPELLLTARAGGLLAAAGLALNLYLVFRRAAAGIVWYWKIILLLLSLKAIAQFSASVLLANFWMSDHGLRIFYLHLLLLGAFSFGLFAALQSQLNVHKGLKSIAVSILLMLASLVLLTPFWPSSWFASWQFYVIAGVAILPSVAAAYYWSMVPKMDQIRR